MLWDGFYTFPASKERSDVFRWVAEERLFNHPLALLMPLLSAVGEMGHGPHQKEQTMRRRSRMRSNVILRTDCTQLTHQGYWNNGEKEKICFQSWEDAVVEFKSCIIPACSAEGLNVFFSHVHRSLKSCLSSISLSLQNRLTSISASRQGIEMNVFQF